MSVRVDEGVNTLLEFRYRSVFQAERGGDGGANRKHGRDGKAIEFRVPVGTRVRESRSRGSELADLDRNGMVVVVARGGRGGRGNARFVSPTRQFPLLAAAGERGEELELTLGLKLLADVGVVGAPNAGKSSLLAAVTSARPTVADYPFTTLEPVLGVVEWRDGIFVMVEVPGLVEGAHSGVGLGHEFLRHVERTKVLVHVIDGTLEDIVGEYRKTRNELFLFDKRVMSKAQIVAVNKADVAGVRERFHRVREQLGADVASVRCVSAVTGAGLGELLDDVARALQDVRAESGAGADGQELGEPEVLRPKGVDRAVTVKKHNGMYVVSAGAVTRVAAKVDEGNWTARTQFYGYLRSTGVIAALEKAGITSGESFKVGKVIWKWE